MSKSTTFSLDQFESGYFLAWNITSQCGNTGTVEIKAGNTVLVTATKTSHDHHLLMLKQGSASIGSDNVTVTVTVNEAKIELKNSKASGTIMDNAGKKVGHVYDICIEDSTDEDYNDFYINLVGWKSMG